MAYIVTDRVKQKTTSSGTGSITLGASVTGFQTFSAVCANGDTFHYAIVHLTNGTWETGVGTYNSSGGTITRSVISSSSGTSLIDFASGDKEIFITPVAGNLIFKDNLGAANIVRTATVDFGSTPVSATTFSITDSAATTNSRIVAYPSSSTANGALGGDEYEMDGIRYSAYCTTNGTITVHAAAAMTLLQGKRNINYIVGSGTV
jgi:hypothetical protein